ncbi:DUF2894 domain-containing protein [Alcaligenaceae bacterium]|nr:DUF2894 domain-containing protein [Alcaligenaceae bacterium]
MNKEAFDCAAKQLADWRERGEDALAPSRFYFIEALSKRMARQDGDALRVLQERLSRQLQAYQDEIVEPARLSGQCQDETRIQRETQMTGGPLAELLDYAASQVPQSNAGHRASQSKAGQGELSLEPALIDYFRNTWASVSANRMLRQSGDQVPDNAGPLNSSGLAHRSLILMQTLSPGYLRHFLSYMDALSWMEQLNDDRSRVDGKSAAAGKRKPAQRKA